MRICLVSPGPPYRGGISDLSALLYSELSKRHDLHFINFKRQYPALLFPGKTEYKEGSAAVELPSERLLDSLIPLSWYRAAHRIRSCEPDLVIFRYWHPFFALLVNRMSRSLRRKGIKVALLVDNLLPHEATLFDRTLARAVVKHADYIFTMSKSVSADTREHTGHEPTRTLFHPLYSLFGDKVERQGARGSLQLGDEPVLLFFGLIRPYKGLSDYIRALGILRDREVPFQGLVVGECYEKIEKYERLIRELDLEDRIRLIDRFVPDEEIPLYFGAADTLVLPYRSATQSGIVGIAFQQDRPVIATKVGGLHEYVIDGKTGYLVEPRSPEQLALSLEIFIKNQEAERMSRNVAEMKSRFSIQRFCQELESALGF